MVRTAVTGQSVRTLRSKVMTGSDLQASSTTGVSASEGMWRDDEHVAFPAGDEGADVGDLLVVLVLRIGIAQ